MHCRCTARKMAGLLAGVVFLLIAFTLASATGPWTERRVENITIQLPSNWQPLDAKKLKQSPFRAAWFLGDQDKPDAGVAIFNLSFVPNVKKKLASTTSSAATVGGRAARQYSIDFEGDGSSTAIVSVIPGAGPKGVEVALLHFAPTKKWAAQKAILEQIIASVRFGGVGSSPPSVAKPTAPLARQTGYYQLDFLRHYNMKRPEAIFKVDGIPVSGYQGGKAHVVWLAKGKTPGDHKTLFPSSYSWPVPSYVAKEILIATNLAWWNNALRDKPVVRLTVKGSGGSRSFDLKVGRHTAEWNGGAITPAPGVVVKTGVPGPSRRWFIARFPLGSMKVTRVDVRLLDAPRWGNDSAVVEIHGITLLGKSATAATSGRQPATGDTSGTSGPQSGSSAGVSGASVAPTAVTSGIRLFGAVKSRPTSKFAGRPANHLRMQTTRWNKIPFHMAPVFRGTVTRRSGQKVFLAGDAAGKANWSLDNFLLLTFSSSRGSRRVVVGGAEPVLLGGARITHHGPNRHGFTAGEIDLTGFLPIDVPVTLTAEALDYGGAGYLSDVYLVIKGGPAGGSPTAAAPPAPAATGAPKDEPAAVKPPQGGGYWRMVKIVGIPRKLGKHQCYIYKASGREGTAHYSIQNRCGKPPGRFAGVVHWDRPPAILWPGKPFPITISATRTAIDPNYGQRLGLGVSLQPVRTSCGFTTGGQKMGVTARTRSPNATVTRTKQFKMPDGGAKSRRLALRYCNEGWQQQYIYQWIPKGQKGVTVQLPPPPKRTRQGAHPNAGSGSQPSHGRPDSGGQSGSATAGGSNNPQPVVPTTVPSPPTTQRAVRSTTTTTTQPKRDYSASVVLRPTKPVFRPDEPIVVHASGLPRFPQIHVSIGPAGASGFKTRQNIKTQGKPEGTFSFKPQGVGSYRIMVWPDPNKMGYSILKTTTVQVKAPPLTATIEQPKKEYNTAEKRIKVTVRPKSLVFVPATLVAVASNAPSILPDHSQVKFHKRFPGLKEIPMNVDAVVGFKPGRYEWRLYEPDTKGRVVARLPFTVVALGPDSPVPDNMTKLPFSDRFSPSAACWRTEGLSAQVKDMVLTVDTSRKPLRTAFAIPFENISVVVGFKANGQPLSVKWGAVDGQGYGLRITPAKSSGQATATLLADGMRTTMATAKVRLGRGAWHQVYLRRTGDDLELRFDGKMVAKVKTARRYKGGAPLTIQGGNPLSVKAVEVLYPSDAPHSGGYQKADARFCGCGPRVLENWLGGLQQHGWRYTGTQASLPKLTYRLVKSETGGVRAVRTLAVAKGKGSCGPKGLRAVFKVGRANSATAYLETYLVMGLGSGSHNFPHLKIELLDDKSKVLGSQLYYAPSAVSPASRANAERRKYAKLKRSAGVVRLYLKEVKPNIEFSQIAISLVNFVCQGDNDITVDQIIFCPSGDCPLSLTEKVDQAAILAEIERLFVDFKISQPEVMQYFLDPPKILPAPQPPLKPAPTSRLSPALYIEPVRSSALPLAEGSCSCSTTPRLWQLATAASGGGCDKAVQIAIDQMRRIKVSLGHDNQLKQALWDMAKSLAKDVKLSPGGLKKAQEWIGKAMDEGEWAYQLYGEVESGKYDEAVQRVSLALFKRLHKKLLDECDKSLQLKKYSKTIRTAWAKSLKKLPPNLRRAELARLKALLGSKLSDEEFHRWIQQKGFDMAAGVDVGKSGGQAAGGEYKASLCTIITTTTTAYSPQVRLIKAALTTYYESLRALRDWITDDRTQDMYNAYREWYDESRGGQGFFDAHSMRDRYPLHKVRETLAKKRGTTHDKVSDDEAWKFLMGQFAKWRKAEMASEQKADGLQKLKAEFMALSPACRRGLDKKLWPKGKYGIGHAYTKRFDPCYYDIKALKRYGQLRQEVLSRLMNWYQPNQGCSGKQFLDQKASFLACKLLADGEGAYRRHMAYILDNCKWLPKPLAVIRAQNMARLAPRLARMSEARLQTLLKGINQEGLLGCLCRTRILMGVGGGYGPKSSKDCGGTAGGLCWSGNWGCIRFPVPTTAKALKQCGVFNAVLEWQIKRRKGRYAR